MNDEEPAMQPFTESTDLLGQSEGLRERAGANGYLFFRGLADRDALLDLRLQILRLCESAGWLAAGTDVIDGIVAPGIRHVEPELAYMGVYNKLMKLEAFHALAHQPKLISMLDMLFGEETLPHPRNIARIIFPQAAEFTTPAHQDFIHIQGSADTWTIWMPLGDCPIHLGSLAIMPGSHKDGIFAVHNALGAGGRAIDTEPLPYGWVASDFLLGDLVMFHSKTVHKGLPNRTANELRLSVDYRYQAASQPIVAASLEPHYGSMPWSEIYTGWKSTDYQYYWRNKPLNVVEWSPMYHETAPR